MYLPPHPRDHRINLRHAPIRGHVRKGLGNPPAQLIEPLAQAPIPIATIIHTNFQFPIVQLTTPETLATPR